MRGGSYALVLLGYWTAYKHHIFVHHSCGCWKIPGHSRFGVRGEGGGFFSCVYLLTVLPHGIKEKLVPEVLDEDAVLILGSLPL